MSDTLNDKIFDFVYTIHCNTDNYGHCGGIDSESRKEVVNEILKLILQEKIDLLRNVFELTSWHDDQVKLFVRAISELTNQLKALT